MNPKSFLVNVFTAANQCVKYQRVPPLMRRKVESLFLRQTFEVGCLCCANSALIFVLLLGKCSVIVRPRPFPARLH
jgi:hypothetical protein